MLTIALDDLVTEIDNGTATRPSVRARLHTLEGDSSAAKLARSVLDEARSQRRSSWDRAREWLGWGAAIVAIILGQHPWN